MEPAQIEPSWWANLTNRQIQGSSKIHPDPVSSQAVSIQWYPCSITRPLQSAAADAAANDDSAAAADAAVG